MSGTSSLCGQDTGSSMHTCGLQTGRILFVLLDVYWEGMNLVACSSNGIAIRSDVGKYRKALATITKTTGTPSPLGGHHQALPQANLWRGGFLVFFRIWAQLRSFDRCSDPSFLFPAA